MKTNDLTTWLWIEYFLNWMFFCFLCSCRFEETVRQKFFAVLIFSRTTRILYFVAHLPRIKRWYLQENKTLHNFQCMQIPNCRALLRIIIIFSDRYEIYHYFTYFFSTVLLCYLNENTLTKDKNILKYCFTNNWLFSWKLTNKLTA